jgi:vitamin B12 transporter
MNLVLIKELRYSTVGSVYQTKVDNLMVSDATGNVYNRESKFNGGELGLKWKQDDLFKHRICLCTTKNKETEKMPKPSKQTLL